MIQITTGSVLTLNPQDRDPFLNLSSPDHRKIDKNFIGIPTEPLGFSNNYKPKGPPSYMQAAFTLAQDEKREFAVRLYRPLGKSGRIGLGVGAISRSCPYRDYNGSVTQVIPAITYNSNRLQVLGPSGFPRR